MEKRKFIYMQDRSFGGNEYILEIIESNGNFDIVMDGQPISYNHFFKCLLQDEISSIIN